MVVYYLIAELVMTSGDADGLAKTSAPDIETNSMLAILALTPDFILGRQGKLG